MGLLDKIKRGLNIGGAKVKINPPGALKDGDSFTLKATVMGGKIDQHVDKVVAKLEHHVEETKRVTTNGQVNDTTDTKVFVLSQAEAPGFDLKPGENKEVSFALKASIPKGMAQQTGAYGVASALSTALLGQQTLSSTNSQVITVQAFIKGSTDASETIKVMVEF